MTPANVLGLGWACTPAGLKGMEALAQLEAERGNPEYLEGGNQDKGRRASNEMCIFLILNISSLQLIPVNMIAYRSQYGSANPTAIIAPAIAATLVSTLVAVVYCKMKDVSAGSVYGGSKGDRYGDSMRQKEGGIGKAVSASDLGPVIGRDRGGKAV